LQPFQNATVSPYRLDYHNNNSKKEFKSIYFSNRKSNLNEFPILNFKTNSIMKIQSILFLLCTVFVFMSCSTNKMVVQVPANDSTEIDYPEYQSYKAVLKNSILTDVDVKVLNKETGEQISGFGLNNNGKAEVNVGENAKLVLVNNSEKNTKLKMSVKEEKMSVSTTDTRDYISFTLRNNTAKSIPLIIPTVMNPNLSPFSNSGVDLKVGQKILFKAKGKKQVLLTVNRTIKNGEVLDVAKLLKERKKELGL